MENKEKIILKDGTEFYIENAASENKIQILISNIEELPQIYKKFTEENLENYTIENSDGLICATLRNKYMQKCEVENRQNDILASFYLADVDMTKKRLEMLEKELEVQSGAIVDLGEAVSGLAEEGGFLNE